MPIATTDPWSQLRLGTPLNFYGRDENRSRPSTNQLQSATLGDGTTFARGTAGKYSNLSRNPDGTYTALRMDPNRTDDNQYQSRNYTLGPDGNLTSTADWASENRDSGIGDFLGALGQFGLLAAGGYGLTTGLGGALAGSGVSPGLTGLAEFAAPTTLTGSAAPLALSGTVAPATIGSLSSMLPAMAGAGGIGTLGAGLLGPMTAPTTLAGSAAPLALSGAAPLAEIGSLSSMLPAMAGSGTGMLTESMLEPMTAPTTLTGAAEPLALSGQAPLATGLLSTAGLPSLAGGSSLFSQATQALRDNPMLGRLLGTLGGGLLGGAFTPESGPRGAAAPAVGRPVNQQAPTMTPWAQSQVMPNGLGSQSAGLFDEYMRQQLGGGTRTFNAPTFGGP